MGSSGESLARGSGCPVQRGRCGGTGCCRRGISTLVMEEVVFRTPSLASSLLTEPLEHHSRNKHYLEPSHSGNVKGWRGYEQLVLKFSVVEPEAAAVTSSRARVPRGETGGMQPLLLGAVLGGNERSKWPNPGTLQTRCKFALYRSWPAAMTHSPKPGSKETTVEEGEQGRCLEIIGLLRPLLLQRWACYKLLDGQTELEMQENGPKMVFYYLGDFCFNRSFHGQHVSWAF